MAPPVLEYYQQQLDAGDLSDDVAQRQVVARLNDLAKALADYKPATSNGILDKLFGNTGQQTAPMGVYIWGDVGRGKTMLMDLYFERVATPRKQRSHFLEFMQQVHNSIHDIRRKQRAGELWEDSDPIKLVGEQIASDAQVLCFDEFQVNDITDAMILGRLFEALFSAGVVIVATSNVRPDLLYRDGLNRNAFMPFIGILNSRMDTVSLDSPTDYRLGRLKGRQVYLFPLGPKADKAIQQLWLDATETDQGQSDVLTVKGRELTVPQSARGVARFDFSELCEAALGAADYIAIAAAYGTVFVENIPVFGTEKRNEVRRFITLIDTLYDRRTKFVASAAAEPEFLYPEGPHRFEFDRTISRLNEMQSDDYWLAKAPR